MAMSFRIETDYGISIDAEIEYEPAEAAIMYGDDAHPGCDESVSVYCSIDWYDLALADAWVSGCAWTEEEILKAARSLRDYTEDRALDHVHEEKQFALDSMAEAQYEAERERRMGL